MGKDEDPLPVNGAAYVGHVLDLIEAMWFRADTVDWPEFRHRHLAFAECNPGQAGVHDVVDGILAELNDGHSHLVRPSTGTAASPRQPPALVGELRDGVGYIEVPWFVGSPEFRAEEFAGRIQRTIADLDQARPYGWMVDLRRNAGGNMWPMLAGLGPLLGSGLIGSFIAQGRMIPWSYENGAACNGGNVLCRAAGQPHVMDEPIGRTAILIGPRTASAGEAVCIAFKGRPGTRFFGDPTAGQSTGNEALPLEDGAVLAIAAAVMVDRLGNSYGGRLMPDVPVPAPVADHDQEGAVPSALTWLNQVTDDSPVSLRWGPPTRVEVAGRSLRRSYERP